MRHRHKRGVPKGGTSLSCPCLPAVVRLVYQNISFCSLCIRENNLMLFDLLSTLGSPSSYVILKLSGKC
jgi:hypothetical protein